MIYLLHLLVSSSLLNFPSCLTYVFHFTVFELEALQFAVVFFCANVAHFNEFSLRLQGFNSHCRVHLPCQNCYSISFESFLRLFKKMCFNIVKHRHLISSQKTSSLIRSYFMTLQKFLSVSSQWGKLLKTEDKKETTDFISWSEEIQFPLTIPFIQLLSNCSRPVQGLVCTLLLADAEKHVREEVKLDHGGKKVLLPQLIFQLTQ